MSISFVKNGVYGRVGNREFMLDLDADRGWPWKESRVTETFSETVYSVGSVKVAIARYH
jgi:hypothetical protein